jgi:hypothetical protein
MWNRAASFRYCRCVTVRRGSIVLECGSLVGPLLEFIPARAQVCAERDLVHTEPQSPTSDRSWRAVRATVAVILVDNVEKVPNSEQGETGSISDWLGWVEQVRTDVLSQHRDCIFESPSDGPLLGLHDVRSSVSAVFAIRDTRQRSRRTGLAVPRILPCMGVEVGDRHDAGRPGAN